ncbi:hypothetical protein BVG16_03670 [Paenibacillus selenitireducens]|uniref:Uncharacterized protein n=1 Tax=Paenibacillus selenitireducens TaxID=1324314 RepID=A0A1T2XNG3_9BACL|nr:hypothetical protein BVG16_03670 [Paenibacillus selenitireducens]
MRNDKDSRTESYIHMFLIFSNRIERYMKFILYVCCCLLIVSQIALRIPWIRGIISHVDKLEGVPISTEMKSKK